METISTMPTLQYVVSKAVDNTPLTDMHTHIYPLAFRPFFRYGIDELLSYHYLVAEFFRNSPMSYEAFFAKPPSEQAEAIWNTLFINDIPVSEATKSLITIFKRLGLEVNRKDLGYFRAWFEKQDPAAYLTQVLKLANVETVIMNNNPLNDAERAIWEAGYEPDPRFRASLRVDDIVEKWDETQPKLKTLGYAVTPELNEETFAEVRRYITDWARKTDSVYIAASLLHDFSMFDGSDATRLIESCVIPVCRDTNLPFVLMLGTKKGTNPFLGASGDSLGKTDMDSIEYLCAKYPKNKFMITMLSYQQQNDLAVLASKFRNLMVFGCWWFLNNPSIVESITKFRLELLGSTFIPQHSDSKILEHMISKWDHFKRVLTQVLIEKYRDLMTWGYTLTDVQVQNEVKQLLSGNFWNFVNLRL